jgi:hypothetical protein
VARQDLGLSATGYGVLLGSIGIGAVGAAMILPRLRERMSANALMIVFTLVYAATTLVLGYVHNVWAVNAAMVATGFAWLVLTSCLNVSAQLTTPAWVQARALGVYLLVFQGGFAAGSAAWGAIAGRVGDAGTLLGAAIALVVGIGTAWRWRLRSGEELDLSPSQHWPEPEIAIEPGPNEGPVLVTVEYHVGDSEAEDFVRAMNEVRTFRLRDGALRWDLFRDPATAERYLETFVIPSWGEHLRQHERITIADKEIEDRALALQQPGTAPTVSHFIAVHPSDVAVQSNASPQAEHDGHGER